MDGMDPAPPARPAVEGFFADHPLGLAVYDLVLAALGPLGGAEVRVTRSQVAFRRRVGFAWLWLPGRWLDRPSAEVVLSIGLRERIGSPRFKEVVQPAPGRWMHHLEVRTTGDIDDEVVGWLRRAAEAAA
jgi:hypothetical protein